ncbi:hypothetical protein M9H77_29441 [Catharanthus roseus]|uniref:Uncharacterized protein n=1 Tax=Catharanthus roseus TaxID=4058 RepID=A0ACB9ZUS0_CATRO|nr:hypothetical protein M9H77_29441 [Catharanthus roseus]
MFFSNHLPVTTSYVLLKSLEIHLPLSCIINIANEISNIIDTFTLNENETQCVGLSQTEVDSGLEDGKNNVFAIVYGKGEIYANGFQIAMSRAWHCESESFKMHVLEENVFQYYLPHFRILGLYLKRGFMEF